MMLCKNMITGNDNLRLVYEKLMILRIYIKVIIRKSGSDKKKGNLYGGLIQVDQINIFFFVAIYLLVLLKNVLMSSIGLMLIRENFGMKYLIFKILQKAQKKSEMMNFAIYNGILSSIHKLKII